MALYEKFISKVDADKYYELFRDEIPWTVFTRAKKSRLIFNANDNMDNITNSSKKILRKLILKLVEKHDVNVLSIFMNYYKDLFQENL